MIPNVVVEGDPVSISPLPKLTLIDGIIYDPALIVKMTQEQLLMQVIARQDLMFPKREHNLDVKHFRIQVVDEVKAFIEQLGIVPSLQAQLTKIAEEYLRGF